MKVHARHCPFMSRQLIRHFSINDIPHRHAPISSARRDTRSPVVLAPCAPDEVALEPCWCAREGAVDAHVLGREGADVVYEQRRVEGVGR